MDGMAPRHSFDGFEASFGMLKDMAGRKCSIVALSCLEDCVEEAKALSDIADLHYVDYSEFESGKIDAADIVIVRTLVYMPRGPQRRLQSNQLIICIGAPDKALELAFAAGRNLKLIHVDVPRIDETADTVMALVLGLLRNTHKLAQQGCTGYCWAGGVQPVWQGMHRLRGRVLGLIGVNAAGRAVAKRALAFGMKVLYFESDDMAPEDQLRGRSLYGADRVDILEELLAKSDVVSVHCTGQTEHILDYEALKNIKRGAFLINVSSSRCLDDGAVKAILAEGILGGCALDGAEPPGWMESWVRDNQNVILLPRSAHHSEEAWADLRARVARVARSYLEEGRLSELTSSEGTSEADALSVGQRTPKSLPSSETDMEQLALKEVEQSSSAATTDTSSSEGFRTEELEAEAREVLSLYDQSAAFVHVAEDARGCLATGAREVLKQELESSDLSHGLVQEHSEEGFQSQGGVERLGVQEMAEAGFAACPLSAAAAGYPQTEGKVQHVTELLSRQGCIELIQEHSMRLQLPQAPTLPRIPEVEGEEEAGTLIAAVMDATLDGEGQDLGTPEVSLRDKFWEVVTLGKTLGGQDLEELGLEGIVRSESTEESGSLFSGGLAHSLAGGIDSPLSSINSWDSDEEDEAWNQMVLESRMLDAQPDLELPELPVKQDESETLGELQPVYARRRDIAGRIHWVDGKLEETGQVEKRTSHTRCLSEGACEIVLSHSQSVSPSSETTDCISLTTGSLSEEHGSPIEAESWPWGILHRETTQLRPDQGDGQAAISSGTDSPRTSSSTSPAHLSNAADTSLPLVSPNQNDENVTPGKHQRRFGRGSSLGTLITGVLAVAKTVPLKGVESKSAGLTTSSTAPSLRAGKVVALREADGPGVFVAHRLPSDIWALLLSSEDFSATRAAKFVLVCEKDKFGFRSLAADGKLLMATSQGHLQFVNRTFNAPEMWSLDSRGGSCRFVNVKHKGIVLEVQVEVLSAAAERPSVPNCAKPAVKEQA